MKKILFLLITFLIAAPNFAQSNKNLILIMTAPGYGPEIVVNGGFDNWTGDDPDDWFVTGEDANNYITEVSGACGIVSDNTSIVKVYNNFGLVNGTDYQLSFDLAVTSGGIKVLNGGTTLQNSAPTGHYDLTFTANNPYIYFQRSGACNVTIDNVSIKEIL
jgi:hypothetical protein